MRKAISLIISAVLILSLFSGCSAKSNAPLAGAVFADGTGKADFTIGNTITIGKYEQDNNTSNGAESIEWIVVENTGNKALLLSKSVLEYIPFDSTSKDRAYKDTTLRAWLIGDFYNNAFTDDEKSSIIESNIVAFGNSYEKVGDTNKVFILSYYEYAAILAKNIDLIPTFSEYVKAKKSKSPNLVWLRDLKTGRDGEGRCFYSVSDELSFEDPNINDYALCASPNSSQCVRPAMWVSLE